MGTNPSAAREEKNYIEARQWALDRVHNSVTDHAGRAYSVLVGLLYCDAVSLSGVTFFDFVSKNGDF